MISDMGRSLLTLVLALPIAGCTTGLQEIGHAPRLTPVAADLGLRNKPSARLNGSPYSLWSTRSASFFRDPRAAEPGDVLTVIISINDWANMDNKSDRELVAKSAYGLGGSLRASASGGAGFSGNMDGSINTHSNRKAKGQGKIERSEEIRLQVAAIVTDTLPNGNLVIRGSQEVRVNNELRILNVVGVVRPRDISGNNTISYDKIAEARVSYGGRGRISEVQQPPYGQQLLDQVSPF